MKRITCLLTALGVLTLWSTPSIGQEEKENGHKKTIVVHTGKVVSFDKGDPATVLVRTEKADLNVELAPMTFIEENKLTLAPDSQVTIRGYETTRMGKTYFVASEVTYNDNVIKLRGPDFKPLWTVKETTGEQPGAAVAVVTYSGKVKTFTRADPAMVIIETDKGEIVTELAPLTYIEEQKILLNPSDVITVRGYQTTRDGKTIFIASELTTPDRRVVRFRSDTREPLWVKANGKTEVIKVDAITDLNGEVTVIETTDTPDGRYVTIKTDAGPRVIAVGPGTYLEKQKYVFTPGDRIRVRGWSSVRAGRPVFLASEVHRGDVVWRFRRPDGRVLWID